MLNTYEKLFSYLRPVEPPPQLLSQIISRLEAEKKLKKIRRQAVFFAVSALVSVIALIPAGKLTLTGMAESGFWQFFSLLFSDFNIVIGYWQNYFLSLLETLPVTGLIFLSITILIFLESLKFLARDLKIINNLKFSPHRLSPPNN